MSGATGDSAPPSNDYGPDPLGQGPGGLRNIRG